MEAGESITQEWALEFQTVRGRVEAFTDALSRLVGDVLRESGLEFAQLEARTKSVESFEEKIVRKGGKYSEPLTDITDLTGLRVIVYYPSDAIKVGQILEREFAVDWDASFRQRPADEPDRFGYRSDHYVVRLKPDRRRLPEWTRHGDRCAEIQVRTVMQHAWAAVDHKIRYKASGLPPTLQRRLYRLSALLELADDQFASLQQVQAEVVNAYETSVKEGERGVRLDALSLRAYLDQAGIADIWVTRAVSVGFIPSQNDEGRAARTGELLRQLTAVGMMHLRHLEMLLESADAWGTRALEKVAAQVALARHPGGTVSTIRALPEYVVLILFQLAAQSAALVHEAKWRPDIAAAIKAGFVAVPADAIGIFDFHAEN